MKNDEMIKFVIDYIVNITLKEIYESSVENDKLIKTVMDMDKKDIINFTRKLFESGANIGYSEHECKMKRLDII